MDGRAATATLIFLPRTARQTEFLRTTGGEHAKEPTDLPANSSQRVGDLKDKAAASIRSFAFKGFPFDTSQPFGIHRWRNVDLAHES